MRQHRISNRHELEQSRKSIIKREKREIISLIHSLPNETISSIAHKLKTDNLETEIIKANQYRLRRIDNLIVQTARL